MTVASSHSPPPSPAVRLTVDRLDWRGTPLFERFSLTFAAGIWTSLLGASGVGKSTLLRLIAGLPIEDATVSAQVTADDGAPLAGRIAWMGQSDLLLPWATALDNVMIGARLRGAAPTAAERDRALTLLAQVGLADAAPLRPQALSGGMRQRCALARTLFEDRPIVCMDEPFSAVDALTRYRLQELAATLLASRTVIHVTHDPNEATRLAGRCVVLGGRPVRMIDGCCGTPCDPDALIALLGALEPR